MPTPFWLNYSVGPHGSLKTCLGQILFLISLVKNEIHHKSDE